MIVDEDRTALEQMENTVKSSGFSNTICAAGADNAWLLLKRHQIDCIICAYEMKEMTGIALLKIIRREDASAELPFFLTDSAFTKLKVVKAGQNGVTGLLVVPVNAQAMGEKISNALNRHEEPVVRKALQTLDQGMKLIEEKKFDQALEVFTSLVSQKENPEYYFNIGYIRTYQGKHPEAIEAFSMAASLDRLFAKAYEEMAKVFRLMGEMEKADESMQQAAQIYMETDKLGAAEDVLNELLESGTESLNVFNTLGVLYRKKGDLEMALNQYQKALKVHPEEPYILYNIGRLYLDLKDNDNAKYHFSKALEVEPDFSEAKQIIKAIELGIV